MQLPDYETVVGKFPEQPPGNFWDVMDWVRLDWRYTAVFGPANRFEGPGTERVIDRMCSVTLLKKK